MIFQSRVLKSISVFIFVLGSLPSHASDEIIRMYRSNRAQALGQTWVTDGDYADALFGNPARHTEVEFSKVIAPELAFDANYGLVSNMKNLKNIKGSGAQIISSIAPLIGTNLHGHMGLLIAGFSPHIIGEKTGFGVGFLMNTQANVFPHFDTYIDSQTVIDMGPHVGFSRKFLENDALSVGINMHFVYRAAASFRMAALDFLSSTNTKNLNLNSLGSDGFAVDSDIGAFYKVPLELSFTRFSLGATLSNVVGATYQLYRPRMIGKTGGTPPPRNPRTLNFGVRNDWPDFLFFHDNFTSIEITDIGDMPFRSSIGKRMHLGAEAKVLTWLAFRIGLNQGYIGGGIGFDLPILKIDLATWGEEIGTTAGMSEDRRFGMRLAAEF